MKRTKLQTGFSYDHAPPRPRAAPAPPKPPQQQSGGIHKWRFVSAVHRVPEEVETRALDLPIDADKNTYHCKTSIH